MKQQFKTLNLSNEFIEHFNGWMLGDGTLSNIKKCKTSASLHIKNINKDYIDYIANLFDKEGIEYKINYNVKGNFEGSKIGYGIETKFYPTFNQLEEMWYSYDKDNKRRKTIPRNLLLTPNTILQWFIGDGYITNLKQIPQRIMFCTDRYNEFELQHLQHLLSNQYNITVQIADRNRLRIPKKNMINFLKQIPSCPVESFKYKWKPLYMI